MGTQDAGENLNPYRTENAMRDLYQEPPKAGQQLYRQQALDRLNSPDQLDCPMIVLHSAAAIAVAGMIMLAVTLLAWAVVAL